MRYGVRLPNFGVGVDARAIAALALEAEEAGWDGFFLWDHLLAFSPGPVPVVDPWIALAAAALSTSSIRLGPMVTPLPRRRPVKLARETASLDHLSDGRLILGVGIGAMPYEYDYLGEEVDTRVRGAMLDEGLEVLTGLWSGEPFGHRGEHYRVAGDPPEQEWRAIFYPPPLQRPRIPIWVGGTWPIKVPFRRAARWDGAFPMKVKDGRIVPMMPEDAGGGALRRVPPCGERSCRVGGSRGDARRGSEEGCSPRGGLRGGGRHLVDREHRTLALRMDRRRDLAVRGDASSSATRTARSMRHGQAPTAPLSRPTPRRSTPITTTGPSFTVRLDSEGA